MTVSYNWLQTYFKSPLPSPEKVAEILTMHSFEVESVEKKGTDYILNIDVLPDRAGDCLSHWGISKELSVLLDKKMVIPAVKLKKGKTSIPLSIKVEDKDCKRYTSMVLTNVKIGPSPKWLQDRLTVCGLNSINNVVDATNFIMLETGQPLHAFDYEKINDGIVIRKARKGEKIVTLSEKEYVLDEKVLLIADSKKPLALAGIKGGKGCEITEKTKTIILESANFNHKLISQTARRLNLRTDASIRFENNLDPNLTEVALERVVSLIQELSGAEIASIVIDSYKDKLKPWTIKLNVENVNNLIGIDIPKVEMVKILTKLGFTITGSGNILNVKVPTSRQDVVIPENLIEEIGRVYGYDKVPAILPPFSEPAIMNKEMYWQNKAKDIMKELGFAEAYNYSFVGEEEKVVFDLKGEELVNPVSNYYKYLRPTAIPQMARIVKENSKFFKEIKVFELGRIFDYQKEIMVLSGAILGEDFSLIKGYLNILFDKLGVEKVSYSPLTKSERWNSKKTAEIKVSGKSVGYLGSLSSNLMDVLMIEDSLFFEIDFDELQKHCSDKREYEQISYHPPALRDISGVVFEDLEIEEIVEAIENSSNELLKSVEVFDVYKGKGIASDKKSVSFHLIYQSEQKTLDSKTIDSMVSDLLNKLKQTINWEERK
ncbi:MAG: phenylalanine--tRNA ligase subunit beta [Candidatus Paceibacterota bacterium]|jgi:phenylalanyl-tRNA synthetase beta chain